jgi:hypothetical protein
MNFNMGDVANALKLKAADSMASGVQRVTDTAASTAKTISNVASGAGAMAKSVRGNAKKPATGVSALVDPLQLWGSLTQQFQQIAASAMKEAATNTAVDATKNMATGLAREAVKAATKPRSSSTAKTARKPVRKTTRG